MVTEPLVIGDGELIIANPDEFFRATDGIAACYESGSLYSLKGKPLKWVAIEDTIKPTLSVVRD